MSRQDRKKTIKVRGNFPTSLFRIKQNEFLKERVAKISGIKTVLNLGATPEDPDKQGEKYKDYFMHVPYYTLDLNNLKENNFHVNADMLDPVAIKPESFDLILFMSTIEHVKNPFIAAENIIRWLTKGGYVYVTSPFIYPLHKAIEKGYSDYWRVTDDGLRILFEDLEEVWMECLNSVVLKVQDRNLYWNNNLVGTGYCALFRKGL